MNTDALTFTEDRFDGLFDTQYNQDGTSTEVPRINPNMVLVDGTTPKGFTYSGTTYLPRDSPNFPVNIQSGDGQYRSKCPIEGVSQGCLVSVDFEMLGEEQEWTQNKQIYTWEEDRTTSLGLNF